MAIKRQTSQSYYDYIMSRCVWDGDCLLWPGNKVNGYGLLRPKGQYLLTHRIVYEQTYGPIPDGLTIDHVWARGCRHRHCCNIAHLEAVTPGVNILRSNGPSALNARKTHCPRGHELSGANLVGASTGRRPSGRRRCRTCELAMQAARKGGHRAVWIQFNDLEVQLLAEGLTTDRIQQQAQMVAKAIEGEP